MQEIEEILKFLMRNHGCSRLRLYCWDTILAKSNVQKKTGDFFSYFQVTIHHQGMSEKKPRGRK